MSEPWVPGVGEYVGFRHRDELVVGRVVGHRNGAVSVCSAEVHSCVQLSSVGRWLVPVADCGRVRIEFQEGA